MGLKDAKSGSKIRKAISHTSWKVCSISKDCCILFHKTQLIIKFKYLKVEKRVNPSTIFILTFHKLR
jgi:hypothetical protein